MAHQSASADDDLLKESLMESQLFSIAWWTHHFFGPKWEPKLFAKTACELGYNGIELAPPEHWKMLGDFNLKCPLALVDYGEGGPDPFAIGWNNPEHHSRVAAETLRLIKLCVESKGVCNKVIAFSGMRVPGMCRERSLSNCAQGLLATGVRQVAEDAGVQIVFEFLNDKVDLPMRGHPGYDATDAQYVADLSELVFSPNFKMLWDWYHAQVMFGDLAATYRKHQSIIGHEHVAGIGPLLPRGRMNEGPQELDWTSIGAIRREFPQKDVWVGVEYVPGDTGDFNADLALARQLLLPV